MDIDEMAELELSVGFDQSYEDPYPEDYCDYCEREGHTFRSCPRRDDS